MVENNDVQAGSWCRKVCGEAGTFLVHGTQQVAGKLDFDPVALGRSYLQRALELNPESTQARSTLAWLAQSERTERLTNLLKGVPKESQYRAAASWPAVERFEYLPLLIQMSLGDADNADYHGGKAAATSRMGTNSKIR